ncbi:MAG: metallophosphoesterase [Deltaproteobacteria bacterium]|nr:metallophosphoesterase [Deltaproteobacteria bacterium]
MAARYAVFFVIASLIMGSAHYYVWARLVRDAALPAPWARVATLAIAVLFAVLMGGFVVFRALSRTVASPIMWVGYTWMGVLFFLVLSLGLGDLVRAIAMRGGEPGDAMDPERRQTVARLFGGAAALLGIGASGVGLASALSPVAVARVKVTIDKLAKARSGYRIVQISDVHVGPTIGRGFIEDVVARINALEPDLVAITGDLVDGSVEELAEHVAPLGKIRAKDGVFFVTGNHEYYSGAEAWLAHLGKLGIRALRNERVRIGGDEGFDLAGIDDPTSSLSDLRKALAGRDAARACVLLAHQPRAIGLADELGVDLQLSGHTHGGQMIPWNFLVRLQQPFVAGLHKLARAQIYVSRGTGYWGPPMRVGAPAEITEIELVSGTTAS